MSVKIRNGSRNIYTHLQGHEQPLSSLRTCSPPPELSQCSSCTEFACCRTNSIPEIVLNNIWPHLYTSQRCPPVLQQPWSPPTWAALIWLILNVMEAKFVRRRNGATLQLRRAHSCWKAFEWSGENPHYSGSRVQTGAGLFHILSALLYLKCHTISRQLWNMGFISKMWTFTRAKSSRMRLN